MRIGAAPTSRYSQQDRVTQVLNERVRAASQKNFFAMTGSRPAVRHGGALYFCAPEEEQREAGRSAGEDEWVVVEHEPSLLRASAQRWVLDPDAVWLLWQRRRPITWNIEAKCASEMRQLHGMHVRVALLDSALAVKIRVRCSTNSAAATEQLRSLLQAEVERAVTSGLEDASTWRMSQLAALPTAGDLELSRSSLVRKVGIPVRTNGFFNATGWGQLGWCDPAAYSLDPRYYSSRYSRLLDALDASDTARAGQSRNAPPHCARAKRKMLRAELRQGEIFRRPQRESRVIELGHERRSAKKLIAQGRRRDRERKCTAM